MNNLEFIQTHIDKPIAEIALLLSKHPELDKNFILNQINGLQKARQKLPTFYKNETIVYPVGLSMEQCSSEQTAIFKSNLVKGKSIIDLTGGFGIDAYFFSKQFEQVNYVEQNIELFKIVQQNFKNLNANIHCFNSSCEDFLKNNAEKFDVAYIDPSRRDESKRVFKLDECTPNVIELLPQLHHTAKQILVKTAPLLDIKQTLKDINKVQKIWIVSVNNDCKEVLYLIGDEINNNPEIITVNLTKTNDEIFSLIYSDEVNNVVNYSTPLQYLYEPNASVLKAGGFKSVAVQFGLKKLAVNTHLYTSTLLLENFPGRTFKVGHQLDYNSKAIKQLGLTKANITTRNFHDSVEQVKKKLKLTDGGDVYLFAVRDLNDKPLLVVTQKIN